MPYTTTISTTDLAQHYTDPNWIIVDCRFKLDDTEAGRKAYRDDHIPGAVYAHLDADLSGPIIDGKGGRHPLPTVEAFTETLCAWGIDNDTQVVAYDDVGGVYAGRLWWMLRWLGHDKVAVLDGGWPHWAKEGHPTRSGTDLCARKTFTPNPQPNMQLTVDDMIANLETGRYKAFDVRDEKRYRGEGKGMDAAAGHIPGAHSAFFGPNLGEDGKFLPPEQLRARYEKLLGDSAPSDTVWYCGSGVSVHHDLIAMELAGFERGALVYIGSWSDWSSDPNRPIATRDTP